MSSYRTTAANPSGEIDYKIESFGGFDELIVTLKGKQRMVVEPGFISYLEGSLHIEPDVPTGLFSGLRRALGGDSLVRTRVVAPEGVRRATLTLAPKLPGSIRALALQAGESWYVRTGAVMAFTEGIVLEEKFKVSPAIKSANGSLVRLTLAQGFKEGMVWIAAYGGVREHRVPEGKSLHIDHGMFLAAPATIPLSVELPGSLGTKIFSGEGLIAKVLGGAVPSVVWTQSRSLQDVARVFQRGGTEEPEASRPQRSSKRAARFSRQRVRY